MMIKKIYILLLLTGFICSESKVFASDAEYSKYNRFNYDNWNYSGIISF